LGFGQKIKAVTEAPHPGTMKVVVIVVVGGISYKEITQVRQVIEEFSQQGKNELSIQNLQRVILVSTTFISNEDVVLNIFRPFL
jgi:hypothetical protein